MATNENMVTNTRSEYVIIIAFPQQWLHESASMLRCTYITCPVNGLDMTTRVPTFCRQLPPLSLCSLHELILTPMKTVTISTRVPYFGHPVVHVGPHLPN